MPACLGTRIILLRMLAGCRVVGLGGQAFLFSGCLCNVATAETEEVCGQGRATGTRGMMTGIGEERNFPFGFSSFLPYPPSTVAWRRSKGPSTGLPS